MKKITSFIFSILLLCSGVIGAGATDATQEPTQETTQCAHEYLCVSETEATCISDGTRVYSCPKCNDHKTETVLATGKHSYKTIEITKYPTCTKKGIKSFYCENCDHIKKVKLSAKGHTKRRVNAKRATYVQKGRTGSIRCITCGKVFKKSKPIKKLKLHTPTLWAGGGTNTLKVRYYIADTDATGFQAKYVINGKSTIKTYKTKKTATKQIKKLSAGTYKVYIRSYVTQQGKTVYSKWTKPKTVKVTNPGSGRPGLVDIEPFYSDVVLM